MFWWQDEVGPGVRMAFTDRGAGNLALHTGDDPAAVRRRRAALERSMGVSSGSLLFLEQVHGTDVVDADRTDRAAVPVADAAVSATGVPLAVMVADCVPVLFLGAGPAGPITAVAHAGRRGLLDGVLERTVERLRGRGADGLAAWVGPSICGRCYEVPAAMREESLRRIPAVAATTSWGTPALDLRAGARDRLAGLGVAVTEPAADDGPACTLEDERLSSHRRDPGSGRIVGLVWRSRPGGRAERTA
ncbi:polyphenol oxidase family protein [Kocuria turfanensis]|uniref:Laccase domain protein n=1 Tax=Kocuria turfanensis TaxID=388357 RepID=A0A512IE51_9MICC|nr:polyphenol oxidase family protein [Kocuria turfanensis]GEO95975.1 laccase domain protein [Kocuria turfanensis]